MEWIVENTPMGQVTTNPENGRSVRICGEHFVFFENENQIWEESVMEGEFYADYITDAYRFLSYLPDNSAPRKSTSWAYRLNQTEEEKQLPFEN